MRSAATSCGHYGDTLQITKVSSGAYAAAGDEALALTFETDTGGDALPTLVFVRKGDTVAAFSTASDSRHRRPGQARRRRAGREAGLRPVRPCVDPAPAHSPGRGFRLVRVRGRRPTTAYAAAYVRNCGLRGSAVGARCGHRRTQAPGVPRVRLGRGRRTRRREPGLRQEGRQARQSGEGAGRAPPAVRFHGTRAHPVGDPRRAHRRQRPPPPRQLGAGRGRAQRHHRELRRAPGRTGRARTPAGVRDRHRGRRAPAGGAVLGHRRPRGVHAPGVAGASRARSRSWPCTPTSPTWWSARAGTRPWWWESARARTSSPRTWPRSSPTPGPRSSWGRTRSWNCAARASR